MKRLILSSILLVGSSAYTYEGPRPLREIKIEGQVSRDLSKGTFRYVYRVTNPATNDAEIVTVSIFLPFDAQSEALPSSEGLTQCPKYNRSISDSVLKELPTVPVGSESPKNWMCGYGKKKGHPSGNFSWSSIDSNLKPGTAMEGFVLTSYAPPGVQEVLIRPDVDTDRLPPEYEGNIKKTVELANKVKWVGKTIGPKAPPKVFKDEDYIRYLISLKDQSSSLGWIKSSGILKSLEAKLDQIKTKIDSGDLKTAKNVLSAFLAEVETQNGKQLSSEAYALLKFNGKYLLDHL